MGDETCMTLDWKISDSGIVEQAVDDYPQFTGRVHCSNYELQPGRTGTVLLLRLVQCFMQVGFQSSL